MKHTEDVDMREFSGAVATSCEMREEVMARFNPVRAFKQIGAETQREKKAAEEAWRRQRAEWAAYGRRSAALNRLMNLFPGENQDCTLDVQTATALLVEYAQTLSGKWVKARVKLVSRRLANLAADGRLHAQDARFKEILLNLLLLANAGNNAKVAEILDESARADPADLEAFRRHLVNWLADKVVDTWPPLPEELKEPYEAAVVDVSPDKVSSMAPREEWLPASTAVERAEKNGHTITLKWLTQDASKHGVRIRPRQEPGRHKKEVEWISLAAVLVKRAKRKDELDDGVSGRLQEVRAQKQRWRLLD